MWNRRTRFSSYSAQDGKIIQYFGRVKLYCIPVILYSTDSYKQLPCNAILMIHMIVLWYNMVNDITSIAFNCIQQNKNQRKSRISLFGFCILICFADLVWLSSSDWIRCFTTLNCKHSLHLHSHAKYSLLSGVNLSEHLFIAFYQFF